MSSFKSLADFLQIVARSATAAHADRRLVRAPIGAGETDPAGGGFAVPDALAEAVMARALETGAMLSRANWFHLRRAFATGIRLPLPDETSRATGSRWGGVRSNWLGEGDTITASAPKFRRLQLDFKKLASLWYVSNELLEDSDLFGQVAEQAFSDELKFMAEDAMLHGTGAGQPLGIFNAPATIVVAKETGQAAATLLAQNVLNMWARLWNGSRRTSVWLVSQTIEPHLYRLGGIAGPGGTAMFHPPAGEDAAAFGLLMGRPVLSVEYCPVIGTPGDIVLADFSQFAMADRDAISAASMAVRFLTDEHAFRVTYRVDGAPMWSAPVTPFQGSTTTSPFVILAQR